VLAGRIVNKIRSSFFQVSFRRERIELDLLHVGAPMKSQALHDKVRNRHSHLCSQRGQILIREDIDPRRDRKLGILSIDVKI
jgi:hypothetical protein